jgi:microsomal dipeptidase-like Zn-dependent dipeptidase
LESSKIGILAAFENASTFCEEDEPLQEGLERLILMFGKVGRPLYIGMTWNTENRFGGGVLSTVGLKEDGQRLLDFLNGKQIAIDLSHASDALAHDILNYLTQQDLQVPVLASHSNVRSVTAVGRNLPTELLQEVIRRRGLVGLNSIRAFVGPSIETLGSHIEEIVRLGGSDSVCFGADFFFEGDVPKNTPGRSPDGWYFPEFDGADRYPELLSIFTEKLGLKEAFVRKMAYQNASDYLSRLWGVAVPESDAVVEA